MIARVAIRPDRHGVDGADVCGLERRWRVQGCQNRADFRPGYDIFYLRFDIVPSIFLSVTGDEVGTPKTTNILLKNRPVRNPHFY